MAIVFRAWGAFASGTTTASAAAGTGATATDTHIGFVGAKPYTSTPTATNFTGGLLNATAGGAIANGNGTGSPISAAFFKTDASAALNAAVTSGSPTMAVQCSVYSSTGTLAPPVGSGAGDSTVGAAVSLSGTQAQGFDNGDLVLFAISSGDDVHTVTAIALTVGGVAQTVTVETKASTASGNDGLMYYGRAVVSGITNGATAWVLTGTSSNTTTAYFSANVVRIREATITPLTLADAAHAQTATTPTLTEITNTTLATAAAAHAQTAGSAVLTQVHQLVVANSAAVQSAQSASLIQQHSLTAQSAVHGHSATSPGTFTQFTQVSPQSASHGQTAAGVALAQTHVLAPANGGSLQTAGNVLLTQVHVLTVANASHAQSATTPTLVRIFNLAMQSAAHVQSATNVAVTPGGVNTISAVGAGRHLQFADTVSLVEVKTMAVGGSLHVQSSTVPSLLQTHPIAQVFSASHGHRASEVALVQNSSLEVEGARHAQESPPTLSLVQYTQGWHFLTPIKGMLAYHAEPLVARLGVPGGVTLLVHGPVVSEAQFPTTDQVDGADMAYLGGHEYVVNPSEAEVLDAAGYGAYLTPVEVLVSA